MKESPLHCRPAQHFRGTADNSQLPPRAEDGKHYPCIPQSGCTLQTKHGVVPFQGRLNALKHINSQA
jgi:hypothetical protein